VGIGGQTTIYRTNIFGDMVLATSCLDLLDKLPIPAEVTLVGRGPALVMTQASWPKLKPSALPDLRRSLTYKKLRQSFQTSISRAKDVLLFASTF
jgi:hypothetical protein